MNAPALTDFALFEDADTTAVNDWAARLHRAQFGVGEPLIREDDSASSFYFVLDGEAIVTRKVGPAPETVGVVRPGSLIGELGLLRKRRRSATVLATAPLVTLEGDQDAFAAMLEIPGVRHRLAKVVAGRLARFAPIVPVALRDGHIVGLRVALPSDRPQLANVIKHMSAESLHRRFFSAGVPTQLIDYLADIDYVDHFAWVALASPDEGAESIGSCRYIRSFDDRSHAEVAFGIVDDWQGKGLGRLFIGALAIAASKSGVDTFTASVLSDNTAMRSIFNHGGAHWSFNEPGILATSVPVDAYLGTFPGAIERRLAAISSDIVWGAGTALL